MTIIVSFFFFYNIVCSDAIRDESLQIVPTRRRSSYQKRSKKLPSKPEPTWSGLGVKGKSHKKSRRFANGIAFFSQKNAETHKKNLQLIN